MEREGKGRRKSRKSREEDGGRRVPTATAGGSLGHPTGLASLVAQ